MKEKSKKILLVLLILILYFIFGRITGLYLYCVFHEITGLYCPGCGVTRMLKSIFRLDFVKAFRYNQLVFISLPFIIFLVINDLYCTLKNKKSIYQKIPNYVWYILAIIFIIYGVLRNIYPILAPID